MSDERRKQIEDAGKEAVVCFEIPEQDTSKFRNDFRAGAEWADSHPQAPGDDEADREAAEAFSRNPPAYFSENINKVFYAHLEGIRAGRRGVVPKAMLEVSERDFAGSRVLVKDLVAEVERLKAEVIEAQIYRHDIAVKEIAEAVREAVAKERQRCANVIHQATESHVEAPLPDWVWKPSKVLDYILNPKVPG